MKVRRPRAERGASATEYGLLIFGIAAVIVVAVMAFGGTVKGLFEETCSTTVSAMHSGSCS